MTVPDFDENGELIIPPLSLDEILAKLGDLAELTAGLWTAAEANVRNWHRAHGLWHDDDQRPPTKFARKLTADVFTAQNNAYLLKQALAEHLKAGGRQ